MTFPTFTCRNQLNVNGLHKNSTCTSFVMENSNLSRIPEKRYSDFDDQEKEKSHKCMKFDQNERNRNQNNASMYDMTKCTETQEGGELVKSGNLNLQKQIPSSSGSVISCMCGKAPKTTCNLHAEDRQSDRYVQYTELEKLHVDVGGLNNCGNKNTIQRKNKTFHINDLPRFLFLHMLTNFTVPQLLNCVSLVCKYWYELCYDSSLWRVINLEDYKMLPDKALLKLTNISDNVIYLNVSDCRKVTDNGVVAMARQCPNLQELVAIRCTQLTVLSYSAIGEYCHKLHCINVSGNKTFSNECLKKIAMGCPDLTEIRLNSCINVDDDGIETLAHFCRKLKVVQLLENRKVTDACLPSLTTKCKLLEILCLHACSVTSKGVMEVAKCNNLTNLDISALSNVNTKTIKFVVQQCKQLTTLNMCLTKQVDDECINSIVKSAKKLRELFLVSCSVTDEALISIGKHSHSITHVDVGWCHGITDRGVREISSTCTQLKYLGLTRCDQVQHSTVENLVKQSPHIHYSTFLLDSKRLLDEAKKKGFVFNSGNEDSQ
ncbi:F-box/LRR-repeat protein 17-like [Saccoglossus kowalevskii]|uniref:F-box/LRR-repeat protein 17-like n=1 Tax=Saccoglossus kowalevskii TaxID=10224 RepID=A0ABM0GSE8_SACKO|nr:PREDICTED: F-box/LRR-repeat protein 17-like [Saccoglossus kowalevskii]